MDRDPQARADFVAIVGLLSSPATGVHVLLPTRARAACRLPLPAWASSSSRASSRPPGDHARAGADGTSRAWRSARSRAASSPLPRPSSPWSSSPGRTACMRTRRCCCGPKTGLKDMVVELEPGSREAGRGDEGNKVRVNKLRTRPRRDPRGAQRRHPRVPAAPRQGRRRGTRAPRTRSASSPQAGGASLRPRDAARSTSCSPSAAGTSRVVHTFAMFTPARRQGHPVAEGLDNSTQFLLAGKPGRRPPGPPAAAARAPLGAAAGARQGRGWPCKLGPALAGLTPGARALGPDPAPDAPVPARDDPDDPRPDPPSRAPRCRRRELRPAMRDLAARRPISRSRSASSTAPQPLAYNPPGEKRRATSSGRRGSTTPATRSFERQDAHRPIRRGLSVLSARHAQCSTRRRRPTRARHARRAAHHPCHGPIYPTPRARR